MPLLADDRKYARAAGHAAVIETWGPALRLYRPSGTNGALAQRLSLAAANRTNPASSPAEHGGNLPTVDVRADRFPSPSQMSSSDPGSRPSRWCDPAHPKELLEDKAAFPWQSRRPQRDGYYTRSVGRGRSTA